MDLTETLVERARGGDHSAFEQLVEAERPRLEALVRSRLGLRLRSEVDVEDIVQETLLQAFRSIARFRWQGEQSFIRWLAGIAENVIRKEHRGWVQRSKVRLEPDPIEQTSPSKNLRRHERFDRLEQALKGLSEDHREVIILARIERLRVNDIARRMERSFLRGTGGGNFEVARSVAAGERPQALVAADFNGDERADLAAVNRDSNDVTVLLGNDEGLQAGTTLPVGDRPAAVVAGDWDLDGQLDLATANSDSGNVTLLRGTGQGTFEAGGTIEVAIDAGGRAPDLLAMADWNSDGTADLLTGNETRTKIFLGRGGGVFQEHGELGFPGGVFVPLEVTGDEHIDLVRAGPGPRDVTALRGNGNGGFDRVETIRVGSSPMAITGWRDGKGETRIATANLVSDDVSISTLAALPPGCETRRFLRGDCNGDRNVGGNVGDAIALLNFNFLGHRAPSCLAACDANGDGVVRGQVDDAVYLLNFAFLGGAVPAAPYPACGFGQEKDLVLGCEDSSCP